MKFKIMNQENFWAGLMFLGFGLLTAYISRDYPMGTVMQMGPGYYPTYLGIILSIIGVIITLTSFRVEGEPIKPFGWRGMVTLSLGFAFFGWAINSIGFLPALIVLILCSAFAVKGANLLELLIMSFVLVVGSIFVFIYMLSLPYPLLIWGR